ncbi:hypothetical protein [Streptacidiphilus jiangxiensis]|uniref:Uncharacterized protein n=1 Tax=Streptacidiphilus jiangxiensis TaxID=235985 RepID=A0A1H7YXY8_STRJI|nr:hypothetical protein [Streptacidiphilus jiangxiensis]SEM50825.1 hypothetical protein SAMN05414137_13144 [Streptacidiphilus jiangxiensis]
MTAGPAFLRALGVEPDDGQVRLLCRELEWFAHPRVRTAAARGEPEDTLVEFLATTELALPVAARQGLESFCAELADPAAALRSPRGWALDRVGEWFGVPAAAPARQLEDLIASCGRSDRPLDSRTVRRLYVEASELCDLWVLAVQEGLVSFPEPVGTADEVLATESAVLGFFDPADPVDISLRRLELADLVRQLTELLALDRWRLLPWRDWPSDEVPSLGWPALLAQAQYRLRQIASAGAPARVEADTEPTPGGGRRHGHARHLLDAFGGGPAESGRRRVRRSLLVAMPWASRLQVLDLGDPVATGVQKEVAALSLHLLDLRKPVERAPGPDQLPLSAWELRELFPELHLLLATCRDLLAHGGAGPYREYDDPTVLPALVADAHLASRGGSGRVAAALAGELAAFSLLFPGNDATDRALGLLGHEPRDAERGRPWWDDLTWYAWLRYAAAAVMRSNAG